MTYISRAIEKTFLAAVRDFKVVLVTGPRQCGKTTMMKKMAEDENRGRKYISLDDCRKENGCRIAESFSPSL